MKLRFNKIKILLVSCLALVAVAFGTLALNADAIFSAKAAGTTLTSTEYGTDGASMRIFRSVDDVDVTPTKGLRFHVEMGNGYMQNGTSVVNVNETNADNNSFKLNEGFKTYTLILPTRLLNGELTVNTENVLKLDTSNFWYYDKDGNLESIAYVYNIPDHRFTDKFSFRGVICDTNGNVLAQTPVQERCVVEIARKSYDATLSGDEFWGDAINADGKTRNEVALDALKSFIPVYEIVYQSADGTKIDTEHVLWGDTPANTPTGDFNAWYNEKSSQEIDLTKAMTYEKSDTVTLVATKATHFSFTGVADIDNAVFNGKAYNGAKVYATLPVGTFPYDEEFDIHAVNVEYQGNGTFKGLEKVFVLNEGSQDRIVFAFDSSNMISGAKIIVKGDSVFYIGGKMFMLDKDYEIEYTRNNNGEEDYNVFLGYIYNSDIKSIYNYSEQRGNTIAKVIRVEFYEDVFINSDFEFVNDSLPQGYLYPVYIHCPDADTNTEIAGGYYYWNEGEHRILELYGYGNHNQDELFGAPNTKLVQNGGYYIFEDEMHAYFNGTNWVVGEEKGSFDSSSFKVIGHQYNDGNTTNELRFTTTSRWFNIVYPVTIENMSTTEPYAIYHTSASGKVTPMTEFIYHGESTELFAFRDFNGTEAGEKITIIKGTRIWCIKEYWTASEDVTFYYNGQEWIVSDGEADYVITADNFSAHNYNFVEGGINKIRFNLSTELFQGLFSSLSVESGSITINGVAQNNLYYHGGGNRLFEIIGDASGPLGANPFSDTLVIEAGTRIWMANDQKNIGEVVEFAERIELRYVGNSMRNNGGNTYDYQWIKTNNNVNITLADVVDIYNESDAGGQVRVSLKAGILQDSYTSFAAVDHSKGVTVINGVEVYDRAWMFGNVHNLFEIRGGMIGSKIGDYIFIPAGSVWWTSQGSLTFVEDIFGIFDGGTWNWGFVEGSEIDTFSNSEVERLYNDGSNEIRVQISKNITGYTYYGPVVFDGDVYVTKSNGSTINSLFGYWYGGGSGTYNANHSLLGIRANNVSSNSNGDLLTIKAGTKIIFNSKRALTGYNVVSEDIVYVYQNGAWASAQGYDVKVNFSNASVSVDGQAVQSGETLTLFPGTHTLAVTAANGYSVTNVSNATNNLDGTYALNVSGHTTVNVSTQQSIKLSASSIAAINVYDETKYGADLTGVRITVTAGTFANIPNVHYGLSWNGSVTSSVAGGVYHTTTFGNAHNLFEVRFATANLKPCDTFTIKAGTVFYGGDNGGAPFAIEWTEDIVGMWNGSQWICNPTKIGDLNWSGIIEQIYSYSDPGTYNVRINLTQALFNGTSGPGFSTSTVTFNGASYTGSWYYHGGVNKILEISQWQYASGDKLIIPAGTRIYIGTQYYETVNTLTATCSADGSGAVWNWTIS